MRRRMRDRMKTNNKMKHQDSKSLWSPPSEKPNHYTYLKEFRVEQCQLFLQHKCTQHRPYTCFHWHFLNQRRRRPVRRRDGTFSYSPDTYCTKFDENTGICPDGDDCPFLHRTAGDTERRYHLRYYKTGMCVHDTDARGMCVKNGPHCAFAHGVDDVRPPVYDIREIQAIEAGEHENSNGIGPNSLDKERNMVNEDPRWQDTAYVLANYKTEPCKRPPRLCRQGYACPQYHNSRDRRRPPKKFKYRSTACPNVKHGDEWGEPSHCDGGDQCQYCHTRTEQQFHPEIYKSTKCNDIQQNGYCPRGAFCAFAHVEQEMTQIRENAIENCSQGTSLADILQSALPDAPHSICTNGSMHNGTDTLISTMANFGNMGSQDKNYSYVLSKMNGGNKLSEIALPNKPQMSSSVDALTNSCGMPNSIGPIGSKPRHLSGSSTMPLIPGASLDEANIFGLFSGLPSALYPKAPGSEREDRDAVLRKHFAAIETDPSIDEVEKNKRKRSLIIATSCLPSQTLNSFSSSSPFNSSSFNSSSFSSSPFNNSSSLNSSSSLANNFITSNVSPLAQPFYPTNDTVQSVLGTALDDLNLDNPLHLNSAVLDRESKNLADCITNSLTSAITSAGLCSSAPVNIPRSDYHERSALHINSQSPSSTSSPGFSQSIMQTNSTVVRENSLDQMSPFLRATNGGSIFSDSLFGGLTNGGMTNGGLSNGGGGMSPHNPLSSGLSQSPLFASLTNNGVGTSAVEVQRLKEELLCNRSKLASWEEGIQQARNACQAWRREVEEAHRKTNMAEREREECFQALGKLREQQHQLDELRSQQCLPSMPPEGELEKLPIPTLKAMQIHLKQEINSLEKVITNYPKRNGKGPEGKKTAKGL